MYNLACLAIALFTTDVTTLEKSNIYFILVEAKVHTMLLTFGMGGSLRTRTRAHACFLARSCGKGCVLAYEGGRGDE